MPQGQLDVGHPQGKRKDVASFSEFGPLCVFARDYSKTHRGRPSAMLDFVTFPSEMLWLAVAFVVVIAGMLAAAPE
jgi:hypothetical protein